MTDKKVWLALAGVALAGGAITGVLLTSSPVEVSFIRWVRTFPAKVVMLLLNNADGVVTPQSPPQTSRPPIPDGAAGENLEGGGRDAIATTGATPPQPMTAPPQPIPRSVQAGSPAPAPDSTLSYSPESTGPPLPGTALEAAGEVAGVRAPVPIPEMLILPEVAPIPGLIGERVLPQETPSSFLYSLAGQRLLTLMGRSPQFSPDQQRIVTSHQDRTYVYAVTGVLLQVLTGNHPRFDRQGRIWTAAAANRHYLHGMNGERLIFDGGPPLLTAAGDGIVVPGEPASDYHSLSGGDSVPLEGTAVALSDHQRHLATQGSASFLYRLDTGEQLATVAGTEPRFSPEGEQLMTIAPDRRRTFLHAVPSGDPIAAVSGRFPSVTADGQRLMTRQGDDTRLFSRQGQPLAELQGSYRGSHPGGLILTASRNGVSRLYDEAGNLQLQVPGVYPRLSRDGGLLVTTAPSRQRSYLYNSSGEQLATIQGAYPSFSADGQALVTQCRSCDRSYIYRLTDGRLTTINGVYRGTSPAGLLTESASFSPAPPKPPDSNQSGDDADANGGQYPPGDRSTPDHDPAHNLETAPAPPCALDAPTDDSGGQCSSS